jgi:hypothetical protein
MTVWAAVLVTLQATATQASSPAPPPDSLLAMADRVSPSVLVELARRDPAAFRDAVATGLRRSVGAEDERERVASTDAARRLAAAHASAGGGRASLERDRCSGGAPPERARPALWSQQRCCWGPPSLCLGTEAPETGVAPKLVIGAGCGRHAPIMPGLLPRPPCRGGSSCGIGER